MEGTLTVRNGDVYMSTYEYFNEWETDDDWWYEVRKVWKDVTTDHVVWDKEHKAFRFVFQHKTESLGMYNIIYDQFEDQLVLEDCESRIKWGDKNAHRFRSNLSVNSGACVTHHVRKCGCL
jgi:hypothetical protein